MHRSAGSAVACPQADPVNSRSIPSNYLRNCRNRAAGRDPGVMGISYRGLGLITLVGTTHDTLLLYVATRGRRLKHPCPTLMYGGSRAHHQAGTTCHIALAVIPHLPSPHSQAMRPHVHRCHPSRCVKHRDGGKRTLISHTMSSCIAPGPHRAFTISSVEPQPKNPRVAFQSCPPQQ